MAAQAEHPGQALDTAPYGFGETRVATLALLTFTALSGWCSCGVVITKFSAHAVTFRSSPTVVADTPMSGSASTRILAGKTPRAMCSAGMLLGLYRIRAPSPFVQDFCAARWDRPAQHRDELASSHSITWSARPRSERGKVMPRLLAALRLRKSSTFVTCCTGRSAAFSPLRMRPVWIPAWRWDSTKLPA